MTVTFLVLIILFAISASYYLVKNDFNSETLSVLFPAVGAIVLSLYLGVKTIWIDAPAPNVSRTNIVLLHDFENGALHSMVHLMPTDSSQFSLKFWGLKKLLEYRVHEEFKDLPEWGTLKKETGNGGGKTIGDIIEFTIFDWLSQQKNLIGYIDMGTVVSLQGASQSGSLPQGLTAVAISKGDAEWNPFIKAKGISLLLPKNSTLTRNEREGPFLHFVIDTPHSSIEFRISSKSIGQFARSFEPLAQKIRSILKLPEHTPSLYVVSMPVEITTKLKPFSRFSDQAKIESEWLDNVGNLFETDFSWDLLREQYLLN